MMTKAKGKARNWMPFYVGSYLKNTRSLSPAEHGAYLLLMLEFWNRQTPLPDDDESLRFICSMAPDEWAGTRQKLLNLPGSFWVSSGFWRHDRLEAEIATALAIVARNVENGAKGGRPKATENPNETQTITQTKPKPNPNRNTSTSTFKEKNKNKKEKGADNVCRETFTPDGIVWPDDEACAAGVRKLLTEFGVGKYLAWFQEGGQTILAIEEDEFIIRPATGTKLDIIESRFGARLDRSLGKWRLELKREAA